MEQVWLVNVHDGVSLFAGGGGDGVQANRPSIELVDNGVEDTAVRVIKAKLVDLKTLEGIMGYIGCNHALRSNLCVVAHASEEAVGDPGCEQV